MQQIHAPPPVPRGTRARVITIMAVGAFVIALGLIGTFSGSGQFRLGLLVVLIGVSVLLFGFVYGLLRKDPPV